MSAARHDPLAIRREKAKISDARTRRVRSRSPHLGNRTLRRRSLREHAAGQRTAGRKRDQRISERWPAHRRRVDRAVLAVRSARSQEARRRKAEASS